MGRQDPLNEGLSQLDGYLERVDLDSGVLVVFDRRSGMASIPTKERTHEQSAVTPKGRPVRVLRARERADYWPKASGIRLRE